MQTIMVKKVVELKTTDGPSYSVEIRVVRRVGAFGVGPEVAAAILAAAKDDAVAAEMAPRTGRLSGARWTEWVLGKNDYGRFLPEGTRNAFLNPKTEPSAKELQRLYAQERRRNPLTGHFLRERA